MAIFLKESALQLFCVVNLEEDAQQNKQHSLCRNLRNDYGDAQQEWTHSRISNTRITKMITKMHNRNGLPGHISRKISSMISVCSQLQVHTDKKHDKHTRE